MYGKMKKVVATALFGAVALSGAANAAVTTFEDFTSFDAAVDIVALVDTSANVGKSLTQLSDQTPGVTFFGPNTSVRSDGLIPHGQGFFGATNQHVGMNFDQDINAVAVTSNLFDGGRILAFSGANGTGTLLGEHEFGGNTTASLFGGLITDTFIGSVIFTCDFNFDLKCGVIDPTFGTASSFLATDPVPLPAAAWLFVSGVVGATVLRRPQAQDRTI